MPLNVRRFSSSVLLVLIGLATVSLAQTPAPSPTTQAVTPPVQVPAPTSGDLMRERISKAKAYIVVRNYSAAIYELENIRKESADQAILSGVNVLLMNSYLEQGDYKRAQDFLATFYKLQKSNKPGASPNYTAVAGQVVKGARNRADRYRALGLNISDRTLPLEALNDLEKMRETLEQVITQSKEIGQTPAKTADAMALLEEATSSRSLIARDEYDARRWKDEVADTREAMASSRSVVLSAIDGKAEPNTNLMAANTATQTAAPPVVQPTSQPVLQPVAQPSSEPKPPVRDRIVVGSTPNAPDTTIAKKDPPAPVPVVNTPPVKTETAPANSGPIDVGSLVGYATKQASPTYPPTARTMRTTGVVRVDVTVDESGQVAEVQKTSGPAMLQAAAKDAIKKWKFRPFTRDGQPVRATGFVSFNFNL